MYLMCVLTHSVKDLIHYIMQQLGVSVHCDACDVSFGEHSLKTRMRAYGGVPTSL